MLSEKEKALLFWLGQSGVASADQLQRKFWPEGKEATAIIKAKALIRQGFLSEHRTDTRKRSERIFCLTQQGAELFTKNEQEN